MKSTLFIAGAIDYLRALCCPDTDRIKALLSILNLSTPRGNKHEISITNLGVPSGLSRTDITMEFGKVPTSELNAIDFNLPRESSSNKEVLSKGRNHTVFYIGCGTLGDKKWIGKLYSEGIGIARSVSTSKLMISSISGTVLRRSK